MDIGQVLGVVLLVLLGFAGGWAWQRQRDKASRLALVPRHSAQLLELRELGELSVFKAVSKDILTQIDHTFGEFGRKYLGWAFTRKRLAMIFEFEMDFRFDLRDPRCSITAELGSDGRPARALVVLPPCTVDVSIRDLLFYDEQRARFLPWLLPDLLQGFFKGGFSEEDKNRLIASAKSHARAEADVLATRYRAQVEGSAYRTLRTVVQSLGFPELEVRFAQESRIADAISLGEGMIHGNGGHAGGPGNSHGNATAPSGDVAAAAEPPRPIGVTVPNVVGDAGLRGLRDPLGVRADGSNERSGEVPGDEREARDSRGSGRVPPF